MFASNAYMLITTGRHIETHMTQNKVVDTCIILVNISQEHQLRLSVYYNYKLTKICKYSIKNKHVQFRSTA